MLPRYRHLIESLVDAGEAARDLARHEGLAADRRLVIEQDAVAGVDPIRLPVVDRDPVGVDLRRAIRRARVEGRRLFLRHLLHLSVHLGGGGLIEARRLLEAENANGLQDAQRAERIGVRRVLGRLEGDCDMALRGEVVDLVGTNLLDHADQVRRVGQIAVVQLQAHIALVGIVVQVIDAICVEKRRAALDTVHLVTLPQQELGEVGAVLAGDSCDECLSIQAVTSNAREL